jgi:hypothetical protein
MSQSLFSESRGLKRFSNPVKNLSPHHFEISRSLTTYQAAQPSIGFPEFTVTDQQQ